MKKEINYLSLPDYHNKYLLTNFNQKFNYNDNISLYFKLGINTNLGTSLKIMYLLEVIFPRKNSILKIIFKKKKSYFGQKSKDLIYFSFNLTLSSFEFIEFYRFFLKKPFNINKRKLEDSIIITRKLKQFELKSNIFVNNNNLNSSYPFFELYHLN